MTPLPFQIYALGDERATASDSGSSISVCVCVCVCVCHHSHHHHEHATEASGAVMKLRFVLMLGWRGGRRVGVCVGGGGGGEWGGGGTHVEYIRSSRSNFTLSFSTEITVRLFKNISPRMKCIQLYNVCTYI